MGNVVKLENEKQNKNQVEIYRKCKTVLCFNFFFFFSLFCLNARVCFFSVENLFNLLDNCCTEVQKYRVYIEMCVYSCLPFFVYSCSIQFKIDDN